MFDQTSFLSFIKENGIVKHFNEPITLKSGKTSQTYINWRHATSDAYITFQLTQFILAAMHQYYPKSHCIYGVAEGASKLAVISQFLWAQQQETFEKGEFPLAMGRGKEKTHGDPEDKYFLGSPKGKVVVLEDVITTGGSLLDTLKQLDTLPIEISGVLVLSDRSTERHAFHDYIKAKNIPFYALSTLSDIEASF